MLTINLQHYSNKSLITKKSIQAPYEQAGVGALSQMQDPRFQHDFSKRLISIPRLAINFHCKQGQNALNAANAATGNSVSGAGMAALSNYNVGTANGEYQQAFNNYQSQQNNQYGRLATLAATAELVPNSALGAAASQLCKSSWVQYGKCGRRASVWTNGNG